VIAHGTDALVQTKGNIMLTQSTLPAALRSVILLAVIGATTNCGGPVEETIGETSQAVITTFISRQNILWGTNCIDGSHTYADVTARNPWSASAYAATFRPDNLYPEYGDPHVGCDKNIIINYKCSDVFSGSTIDAAEANNRVSPPMSCYNLIYNNSGKGLVVVDSAKYGRVGHTQFDALYGANGVKNHCDNFISCQGFFENKMAGGDPEVGADKPLTIKYHCSNVATQYTVTVAGEANHKTYMLTCD